MNKRRRAFQTKLVEEYRDDRSQGELATMMVRLVGRGCAQLLYILGARERRLLARWPVGVTEY